MSLWLDTIRGMMSALSTASSPLYRYPYRNADEAFRGDWKRIGGDIEAVLEKNADRGS